MSLSPGCLLGYIFRLLSFLALLIVRIHHMNQADIYQMLYLIAS